MKELSSLQNAILMVGGILMISGAAVYRWYAVVAFCVFSIGCVAFCGMQMLQQYEGKNFIIKRLRRQQLIGDGAFLATACCMAMQTFRFGFTMRNEWVVCMLIGCVLQLYTAYRIPAELKKEQQHF